MLYQAADERKNRAIVDGAGPVTSLPRGGARITHVFCAAGRERGRGGGEETFFSQVDARVRTVYCFPFRYSGALSCALTCDKQTAFPWNCTRFEGSIFTVFPFSFSSVLSLFLFDGEEGGPYIFSRNRSCTTGLDKRCAKINAPTFRNGKRGMDNEEN